MTCLRILLAYTMHTIIGTINVIHALSADYQQLNSQLHQAAMVDHMAHWLNSEVAKMHILKEIH